MMEIEGIAPAMIKAMWKELEEGLLYFTFSSPDPSWDEGLTVPMFWSEYKELLPNIRCVMIIDDYSALMDVQDVTRTNVVKSFLALAGDSIKWQGHIVNVVIQQAKEVDKKYLEWICELLMVGTCSDNAVSTLFFEYNSTYGGTPPPSILDKPGPTGLSEIMKQLSELGPEDWNKALSEIAAENKRRVGKKPLPVAVGPDGKPIEPISPHVHFPFPPGDPHSTIVDQDELGKSLATASQALLKTMFEGGVLKKEPPKLDFFTGKPEDSSKCNWEQWEYQILYLRKTHTDQAIKEAMQKAAKGDAGDHIRSLGHEATWELMLKTLKSKYKVADSFDSLMIDFYKIIKTAKLSVTEFATAAERQLSHARDNYPERLPLEVYNKTLRDRIFHGLPTDLRNGIRYQYNNPTIPYFDLLEEARKIDKENKQRLEQEELVSDISSSKNKPKTKGSSTQAEGDPMIRLERAQQASKSEMQNLQKKLEELTAALGNMQTAQPSSAQTSGNSQQQYNYRGRGRGGRGGQSRGRGYPNQQYQQSGRTQNSQDSSERLCYWCKGNVPADQANHLIRDCPHYTSGRAEWWSSQSKYPKGSDAEGKGNNHTHAQAGKKSQGNQSGVP